MFSLMFLGGSWIQVVRGFLEAYPSPSQEVAQRLFLDSLNPQLLAWSSRVLSCVCQGREGISRTLRCLQAMALLISRLLVILSIVVLMLNHVTASIHLLLFIKDV